MRRRSKLCLRSILSVGLLVLITALSGCELLKKQPQLFVRDATSLRPLVSSRDAIQLEVVFVERPVRDPLLSTALWNEVDQIGALTSDVRSALNDAGFRVGFVGSTPTRALQSLLELTSQIRQTEQQDPSRRLIGRRVSLRSGQETEIETSPVYPMCVLATNPRKPDRSKPFRNARCVYRVQVKREQDGWVNLDFLPEIHHGNWSARPTTTASGWQYRTTQNIVPLFDQRFSINLSVGEMVLLASGDAPPGSLGQHFFRGVDDDARVQRLLVVRLADMRNIDSVYADE